MNTLKEAVATIYAEVTIPQQHCTGSQVEASASCQDSEERACSQQHHNTIPLPVSRIMYTDKAGCWLKAFLSARTDMHPEAVPTSLLPAKHAL